MSSDLVVLKLDRIKNKVESSKAERSRLEGKREMLMTSFKKNFSVDTIEAAEEKYAQLVKESDVVYDKLKDLVKDLDELVTV